MRFLDEEREREREREREENTWPLVCRLDFVQRIERGTFCQDVWEKEDPKVNTDKSKGLMLSEKGGLECKVLVGGIRLEHVSKFKYLGCVLDESDRDGDERRRKIGGGRKVAGTI